MFKRILSIFIAILFLFCSSFAFAISFDSVFPNGNFGGYIRSDPFALSVLNNLEESLGITFPQNNPFLMYVHSDATQISLFSTYYPSNLNTNLFHMSINDNDQLIARYGNSYNVAAESFTTYRYAINIDSTQFRNGVFSPTSAWFTIGEWYPNVSVINNSTIWYGNASVSWYDETGDSIPWPSDPDAPPVLLSNSLTLSPGNMLVLSGIDQANLSSIYINGKGLPPSNGISDPRWFTGLRIGPISTLGYLFLNSGSNSYNSSATNAYWEKSAFSVGLDGISTDGYVSLSSSDYPDDFFFIYNPIGINTSSGFVYNPSINISFAGTLPTRLTIYPAYTDGGVTYFPSQEPPGPIADMYDPEIRPVASVGFNSDGTVYYFDSNRPSISSAFANVAGGYNSFYESTSDPSNSVQSSVDGILNILQSGSSSVESLTNGSQSFFATLKGMFAWLPDEVLAILIAALILVFTIGVIKVLL